MERQVYISAAKRTSMGGFKGSLSAKTAPELGGAAIKGVLDDKLEIKPHIDEVIMGCVLPAGLGQAPARQAGFQAGLSDCIPATTINKMCGSGMKAVMLGYDQIRAGDTHLIVAGGMESMTNAPYLTSNMRSGARLGHQEI